MPSMFRREKRRDAHGLFALDNRIMDSALDRQGVALSFFLVLRLQLGHNRRIGQRGCISQDAALSDIAQ